MLLKFWRSILFFDNWVRTFQVICVVANEQLECCITRARCHGDDAGMKLYRTPGTQPSPPRAGGKIGLFLRWPGQCVECHGIHYTGGTHHDLAGDMEHRGRMHHYWRRRGEDTLPRLGWPDIFAVSASCQLWMTLSGEECLKCPLSHIQPWLSRIVLGFM